MIIICILLMLKCLGIFAYRLRAQVLVYVKFGITQRKN